MKMPINMKDYKTELRQLVKKKRGEIPKEVRKEMDAAIHTSITSIKEFKEADTLLCFVSLPNEIDTKVLIAQALEMGKKVAVPRCIAGTRLMEFYYIESLSDLTAGSFNVLEPPNLPERLYLGGSEKDFMVVPCLSCDTKGYRLGYGGGYYDRFLETYQGYTAVITYHSVLLGHFWHGKFDFPCDIVVTDRMVKYTGSKNRS